MAEVVALEAIRMTAAQKRFASVGRTQRRLQHISRGHRQKFKTTFSRTRLPPFEKPELAAYWKAVGDLGLAIQLHFEPRYAPGFEKLIRDFADVPVLVDHLGRPLQGTEKEYEVVLKWSKFKNVTVKLSSVPDRGKYPHRDPAKIVKQLTDAFGADRLMYGGGYDGKATGASYRAERERVREFLGHLMAADQAKVFGGTAAKLFKFA